MCVVCALVLVLKLWHDALSSPAADLVVQKRREGAVPLQCTCSTAPWERVKEPPDALCLGRR